jgi:hypothetical protein
MTTEVNDLIAALRDGTMNLDQVAQRFRNRPWPRRAKPLPTTYMELATAAQEDPEPTEPGSFDEVDAAYYQGKITDEQYEVLAQAMAESMRAEDRINAEEAADRAES